MRGNGDSVAKDGRAKTKKTQDSLTARLNLKLGEEVAVVQYLSMYGMVVSFTAVSP